MPIRLDELLVARKLAPSRSAAAALLLSGKVRHRTEVLDKPGKRVHEDLEITVLQPPRFVSRGGDKLEGYLKAFPLDFKDKTVLDVGASTGGFTDCALQHGARAAVCVDVGHGQLHYKLQQDGRVTNIERCNARHLQPGDLPHASYDVFVMDLSFISVKKVLPAIWPFLVPGGTGIVLVKPQFEADKKEASRGKGVIRDQSLREAILLSVTDFAREELPACEVIGSTPSPLRGADGNQEFLLGLFRKPVPQS